jgi:hypothetical protein
MPALAKSSVGSLSGTRDELRTTRQRGSQISYSYFSNRNICRRIVTFAGSDDGELHAFDSGQIQNLPSDPDDTIPGSTLDCLLNVPTGSSSDLADLQDDDGLGGGYDYGAGRELFAFIPDAMMPVVKELSTITELTTEYGVDGTVRVADVFIEPVPSSGVVTGTEREWRTVLLGTYREAGRASRSISRNLTPSTRQRSGVAGGRSDYVPSCTGTPGPIRCRPTAGRPSRRSSGSSRITTSTTRRPTTTTGRLISSTAGAAPWWRIWFAFPTAARRRVGRRPLGRFGGGRPSSLRTTRPTAATGHMLTSRPASCSQARRYRRQRGGTPSPAGAERHTAVDTDSDGHIDWLYFAPRPATLQGQPGNGPFELDADGRIEDPAGEDG